MNYAKLFISRAIYAGEDLESDSLSKTMFIKVEIVNEQNRKTERG